MTMMVPTRAKMTMMQQSVVERGLKRFSYCTVKFTIRCISNDNISNHDICDVKMTIADFCNGNDINDKLMLEKIKTDPRKSTHNRLMSEVIESHFQNRTSPTPSSAHNYSKRKKNKPSY
ncbi:hypothetical protein HELRODRAFT_170416 [Helobdella robusta]|uniref:Uncharacterized protein n=1 Tax=Helobdella robusta TaxID=6412 RepID=T1F311_HELRO|nr:hypothetical protein HELRODRAFT_170416 [Helobdella robusta]ESO07116.1 hypothetical protein HELRODRAFT_170416 [Helobdella robusta]